MPEDVFCELWRLRIRARRIHRCRLCRFMIAGFQHELIVLPAAARPHIPARLRRAGIDVAPSQQPAPAKLAGSGTIFECRENNGSAQILIMDETSTLPEHRSMALVLIFPVRGKLAEWFSGTMDQQLRNKIHKVLYAFKSEVAAQQT